MPDLLKILIATTTSAGGFLLLLNENPDFNETDMLKFYFVCIVRLIVLLISIQNDWPIEYCTTINVILVVLSRYVILLTDKNNKELQVS